MLRTELPGVKYRSTTQSSQGQSISQCFFTATASVTIAAVTVTEAVIHRYVYRLLRALTAATVTDAVTSTVDRYRFARVDSYRYCYRWLQLPCYHFRCGYADGYRLRLPCPIASTATTVDVMVTSTVDRCVTVPLGLTVSVTVTVRYVCRGRCGYHCGHR